MSAIGLSGSRGARPRGRTPIQGLDAPSALVFAEHDDCADDPNAGEEDRQFPGWVVIDSACTPHEAPSSRRLPGTGLGPGLPLTDPADPTYERSETARLELQRVAGGAVGRRGCAVVELQRFNWGPVAAGGPRIDSSWFFRVVSGTWIIPRVGRSRSAVTRSRNDTSPAASSTAKTPLPTIAR